ncbi:alpha integrin [Bathymodiolus thermophilus thioautotrophic gill symbiont]|uniref:Alpha integrin n=1 Tax=Bathymodiolus thermophilus thioautotrophic gill symbiont TaxID=2360 RepID=A0A3G3INH6_9GAMM|nr:FG-GAP-like repeat-containing protein [Bathymodiolus thermophilus thioautotrophic gill symbiont]AYQ57298.1 alpha integrin [Bathymodiolus thermophilus thioautotrophic gill symbiont]
MQAETQKQIMSLQNKAKKIADKLNEEVITIAKGIQHIQTQAGIAYQINSKDFNTKKLSLIAKKIGDDLEIALAEDVVVFDNYFNICSTDLSCLVSLPTKDGGLYHIVADTFFTLEDGTQVVYFYGEQSIVSTESSAVSADDDQSFLEVIKSNIGIVAAVAVVVVAAAIATNNSGGNDGDDDGNDDGNGNGDDDDDDLTPPPAPKFTFVDTGSSSVDGITNNGTITISGLEPGATWQYSTDGGANFFTNGIGNNFVLNEGTYDANAIQIKQTDVAGNTSNIFKNALPIIVDTTGASFTSATIVNVEINTDVTETIYTAAATDDYPLTYSLKEGNQKDKFTINIAGELKYKQKQTQAETHKVSIIATDTAGNEVEQLITVSVKNPPSVPPEPPVPPVTEGFVINGENAGDKSGWSVSSAGDVNGDGLDDLILGSPETAFSDNDNVGRSYVVFGKTNATVIDLSNIASGTGGFVINGAQANDYNGYSVSSIGDFNGDGLDDLIIGSRKRESDGNSVIGKSHVVFGKTDGTVVNLSNLGTGGLVINGEQPNDHNGYSVSSAGDVNGDGLDDLIIGAWGMNNNAGRSYVLFGVAGNPTIDLSNIVSGTGGFAINGENAGGFSGYSVSSAGDVDGDGFDDLIIGAWGIDSAKGRSYVVFGKTDGTIVDLSNIASGIGGFAINGDDVHNVSGSSVSSAGDVNGDGLDDLIVGSIIAENNRGKAYVVFGKKEGSAVNLGDIASGTGGFVIRGEKDGDKSGHSVTSIGDFNGDGLDDLAIGTNQINGVDKENYPGETYVVFGKADGTAIELSDIASGSGGFIIRGEKDKDWSGVSVSSAGDVNGDGLDDLIVGSPQADPNDNNNAGKAYVVFGKTNTETVDLANISKGGGVAAHAIDFQGDANANILTGTSTNELFVAGLGDDILTGNGGFDVFNAGAGNDTIIINDSNIATLSSNMFDSHLLARVDGGYGLDTLKLAGENLILDLANIDNNRIQGIEIIDLTGSGSNTLKLNVNDLLHISNESNILRVIGDSNDKVKIELSDDGFFAESPILEDGVKYYVYSSPSNDFGRLWVGQNIVVENSGEVI